MDTKREPEPYQLPPHLALSREDGALSITFIGAGNAFTKKFYQNNVLLVKGSDHVLIDCGSRAPEALALLDLSVTKVRNYLITHSHADHVGGLEEVMLMNRYMARQKSTNPASASPTKKASARGMSGAGLRKATGPPTSTSG